MDLEEQEGVESAGELRCEVCGVELTASERRAVLQDGAPVLCTVHAAEEAPLATDQVDVDEPA